MSMSNHIFGHVCTIAGVCLGMRKHVWACVWACVYNCGRVFGRA